VKVATKVLLLLCLLATIFSSQVWASNPTRWSLKNQTDAELFIECENPAPGLLGAIHLPTQGLAAGVSRAFSWNGYDNDGMGLNAGTWACAVGTSDHPLGRPGVYKTSFRTDWGQDITLTILKDRGQLTVRVQ
jgi:hypothetical protein